MKKVKKVKKIMVSLSLTSLFLFFLIGVNPTFASSGYLSVENYSQERSNWCWVTGVQIVADYLENTFLYQCTYYRAGKQVSTCSNNSGSFYDDTRRALERGNVYPGSVIASPITYTGTHGVEWEVDYSRPVLIRIGWKSTGLDTGHMLVINGYSTYSGNTVDYVYIQDGSYAKAYTSDYRSSSYGYLTDNSQWQWTHSRYNMN